MKLNEMRCIQEIKRLADLIISETQDKDVIKHASGIISICNIIDADNDNTKTPSHTPPQVVSYGLSKTVKGPDPKALHFTAHDTSLSGDIFSKAREEQIGGEAE